MRIVRHPVLCNYYLTYRCNAKCGFCDIWEKPSPYVTEEHYLANLKALKKLGVKVIDFTGGEPLLHQQLPSFLAKAKEMGFITTVTTNALLYPKMAERLAGKIDMLHFSLDDIDEATHNKSRGVNCYQHIVKSLKVARSLGEKPDILFTVHEGNVDQVLQVYQQFCEQDNLVLILNPLFAYNEVGAELDAKVLDQLSYLGKQKGIYLNEGFIALRRDGGNQVSDPVCKAASTTLVISPKNELVLPCYHLGEKSFPITDNLYDLYKSKSVQVVVAQEGRLSACQGCTINCYMQPSFAVNVNKYFWKALGSTLKYNRMKGTWKELF